MDAAETRSLEVTRATEAGIKMAETLSLAETEGTVPAQALGEMTSSEGAQEKGESEGLQGILTQMVHRRECSSTSTATLSKLKFV